MDYSKWDNVEDSGDDDEKEQNFRKKIGFVRPIDDQERIREDRDEMDKWLRRQIAKLEREEPRPRYRSCPELREEQLPMRQVTKDERAVLAMLIAVSNFEEGSTNLDRHPQMLELVRHHRFLEEDPGTLELLCRIHNHVLKKAGGSGHHGSGMPESDYDKRMRDMCFCGINTLAAAPKLGCKNGLLELVSQICTPTTDFGHENRRKWQKKEFAKDAVIESLFPDMRNHSDASDDDDSGMGVVWLLLGVIVLIIVGVVLLIIYGPGLAEPKIANRTLTTTMAPFTSTVAPEEFGPSVPEQIASSVQDAGKVEL